MRRPIEVATRLVRRATIVVLVGLALAIFAALALNRPEQIPLGVSILALVISGYHYWSSEWRGADVAMLLVDSPTGQGRKAEDYADGWTRAGVSRRCPEPQRGPAAWSRELR